MSYWTDISQTKNVPVGENAASHFSNSCGDILVATGYFRLVSYANVNNVSELSNPCIVNTIDNKIRIKLYANNSAGAYMRLEYITSNQLITTKANTFESIINNNATGSYTINIRLLHLKHGVLLQSNLNLNNPFLVLFQVSDLETNQSINVIAWEYIMSGYNSWSCAIGDGMDQSSNFIPIGNMMEFSNTKQILLPICISRAYTHMVKYMTHEHFANSRSNMYQGFVEMNSKKYFCTQYLIFEIEDR